MNTKLIFIRGAQATGKTTLARIIGTLSPSVGFYSSHPDGLSFYRRAKEGEVSIIEGWPGAIIYDLVEQTKAALTIVILQEGETVAPGYLVANMERP